MPSVKKNSSTPTPYGHVPVTSLTHHDKRANIPTEELHDFVADQEKDPKAILYPRDPSLDPQLVWKGKDEQDQHPLEVPAVPVYIQEKISPQAIIENVRAHRPSPGATHTGGRSAGSEEQLALFADFNNISFEDLVDFYHHEQNWSNRMILGDSLLVMTSLAEKEGLKGRVQMIYIDPPYGIKFGSNWQVSTRKRDVKDGKEEDLTRQPEQIKAFRDTWELGIHSYLAYLRDRLTVARELLTDSGSVFVQIGDENLHLVRSILDEVFGSENFCSIITIVKTAGQSSDLIPSVCDYIVWYSKNKTQTKFRQPFRPKVTTNGNLSHYSWIVLSDGIRRGARSDEDSLENLPPDSKAYAPTSLISQGSTSTGSMNFVFQGKDYDCGIGNHWKTSIEGMKRLNYADRIHVAQNSIRFVRYLSDFPAIPFTNFWEDTATGNFTEDKIYVVQTATKIIERCLLMTTDPGDLVLDPTCGSGTTAYVAEQWGRRWITIDTSRVAIALARTRLMAGRFPYYLLSNSAEGMLKEAELNGQLPPQPLPPTSNDVKRGFVYKRVPHITLKAIANNEEIDAIHEKFQAQLERRRAELNRLMGQTWEEWQAPREMPLTPALSRHPQGVGEALEKTLTPALSHEAGRGSKPRERWRIGGSCAESGRRRSTLRLPGGRRRAALRPALRGEQKGAGERAVYGRVSVAAPGAVDRAGTPGQRAGRPEPGGRQAVLKPNYRKPAHGGRAEHQKGRAAQVHPPGTVRRNMAAGGGRV